MDKAERSGYYWDAGLRVWYKPDNVYVVPSSDQVKVEILSTADGTFELRTTNYGRILPAGDQKLIAYPEKNLYYDWIKDMVAGVYPVKDLGNGFTLFRRYVISKTVSRANIGGAYDCKEADRRFLIYHSADAADSGWTDATLDKILPFLY